MRKDYMSVHPALLLVQLNFGGRLLPEKWSSLDLRANPSKDDAKPRVAYPLANSEMETSLSIDTLTQEKIYPALKLETA